MADLLQEPSMSRGETQVQHPSPRRQEHGNRDDNEDFGPDRHEIRASTSVQVSRATAATIGHESSEKFCKIGFNPPVSVANPILAGSRFAIILPFVVFGPH
ncbi:hypothetical protein [Methylorubrum thiocyanatum]|uniref:hypothetical protein n=1 Tax=Methylorubrum thiocyanatum TaxID=47958 RepID=UPI0035C79298